MEIKQITKRDGRKAPFSIDKIAKAIYKAAQSVNGCDYGMAEALAEKVESRILSSIIGRDPSVEEIQDIVEETLIDEGHARTAKAYILYRAERTRVREANTALMKTYEDLTFSSAIESDTKRENANINGDTAMGVMLKYGSEGAKKFNLLNVLDPRHAKAHSEGDIHIHDLDFYTQTTTCISENSLVTLKINGEIKCIEAKELPHLFNGLSIIDNVVIPHNAQILSNGRFVDIKNIVAHDGSTKQMLRIKTLTGKLDVTDDHMVTIMRKDGKPDDVYAKDLKINDRLITPGIDTKRFTRACVNLLDLMPDSKELCIYNSDAIIDNIKSNGNWKALCNILTYKSSHNVSIRNKQNRMTIAEFNKIRHLCTLPTSQIKIAYKRTRGKEYIFAEVPLTYELGRFIGLMYSDGSFSKGMCLRACFTNFDDMLIRDFNNCVDRIFQNTVKHDRITDNRLAGTYLSGYLAYALFHGAFGVKNNEHDISMAHWMYEANENFINGLLSGVIDGDGMVQKDGYRIRITSICPSFLKQLQTLLRLRGIQTVIKKQKTCSAHTVARFTKNTKVIACTRNYDCYGLESAGNLNAKFGWLNAHKIKRVNLSASDKKPFKYCEITAIEALNDYKAPVYDFETEDNHFDCDGFMVHNCCQIDLKKLFAKGFSTGHGNLRTPNGIQSYAALACIAIQSNQNDQHGGQSVPAFDYDMAEGVAKTFRTNYASNLSKSLMRASGLRPDSYRGVLECVKGAMKLAREKYDGPNLNRDNDAYFQIERENIMKSMYSRFYGSKSYDHDNLMNVHLYQEDAAALSEIETNRATYQAMEALIHNLNTMNSRAGAQVPFSSINYGTDTSPEGRMVIKNLLLATQAGLGGGETPIFPVQIFKVKSGVNYDPGDPNYDLFKLAMETSAKRMFPNFSFIDAPFNLKYYKPGDYRTEVGYMGCRTRVMGNVYDPDREITPGRGNLSFTTINLPRLAIESHGSLSVFYEKLDRMMNLVTAQLMHRYKIIAQKTPRNFPFLMGQGVWIDSDKLDIDEPLENILKHGTLSIGFIGLAETLVALTGKHHGESPEAQETGLGIISHMREYCDKKSKLMKMNFTLLATPAEGLSGRFVNIDKKRYGVIPGVTDQEFYTNSFHVPVYYNIPAFKKLEIEGPYHELTNAGHISYIELDGDPSKNIEAFEQVIRCMHDNDIGYGAINHPIDRDPICGFNGIIDDECPCCHRRETIEITERIARPKF